MQELFLCPCNLLLPLHTPRTEPGLWEYSVYCICGMNGTLEHFSLFLFTKIPHTFKCGTQSLQPTMSSLNVNCLYYTVWHLILNGFILLLKCFMYCFPIQNMSSSVPGKMYLYNTIFETCLGVSSIIHTE